jgi:thiamine pyrophosphate-dependent acetolactate synthase large subunit-like protein
VRLKLGITVIVLVDDALSQIKAAQERKKFPVAGTTFGGLDYRAIAESFAAAGFDVLDSSTYREALAGAVRHRPTLVVARIDPSAYRLD